MKYIPTVFDTSKNVSLHRPIPTVIRLLAALLGLLTVIYLALGLAIDVVAEQLTIEQENWLWQQLKVGQKVFDDPVDFKHVAIQLRVEEIFAKIDKSSLKYVYPFKLYVIQDKRLNAFAMPGGRVVITAALVNLLPNDNAIAFALGHELGHFQNRDHLKGLGRDLVLTVVLKFVLGDDVSGLFARLTLLFDNQYAHSKELKADQWGLRLLNDTYGHVQGATTFFEWLDKNRYRSSFESLFESHPAAKDRVKHLRQIINEKGYRLER